MQFAAHVHREHGVTTVVFAGELDMATVCVARAVLAGASEADDLVIDLSELTFIDAAGSGALQLARREARRRGTKVSIVGACNIVSTVLVLLHIIDVEPGNVIPRARTSSGGIHDG